MKTLQLLAIIACTAVFFSCANNSVTPDSGFIKSKVNGVEMIYSTEFEWAASNWTFENELHIAFQGPNEYLRWSIDVVGVDLKNASFPLVLTGPRERPNLNDPAFWINILDRDPRKSFYGHTVAGTASTNWNATLTITSFDGNSVSGTFEGEGMSTNGNAVFKDGKFLARFAKAPLP